MELEFNNKSESITAKDIADVLNKEYKINIDKKKIDLKESIKTPGVTKVNVKLYEGVIGEIKIDVIPEQFYSSNI